MVGVVTSVVRKTRKSRRWFCISRGAETDQSQAAGDSEAGRGEVMTRRADCGVIHVVPLGGTVGCVGETGGIERKK